MNPARHARNSCLIVVFCGPAALFVGCSQSDFGEALRVAPGRRTVIDDAMAPGDKLVIPRDAPFAIADAQRQSSDSTRAESSAAPTGVGRCAVGVVNSGTAAAEFQVGHVVYGQTSTPVEAVVTFDCAYRYELTGEDVFNHPPEEMALKLHIQDSDKVMLHKELLINLEGPRAATRRSGREVVAVNVTLQPHRAYHLVVAGRVAASAGAEGAPLDVAVEVSDLAVTVAAR